MIEIYIEDTSIDLFEGTNIAINYTNSDIVSISTKGNFSYNITVPKSKTNKRLFVFPELDAIEAFNSQIKKDCRIEYNGTVILNGYAIINSISEDGYDITCYDGNSNWISEIKELRLTDLDWSLYNHTYTKANIDASETWTLSNRYVYPLVQYGVLKDNFVIQDRTPWLNVYHLLNDIFQAQGYSITSNFIGNNFFRRLYFSPKGLPSIADSVIEANKFYVGYYGAGSSWSTKPLTFDGNDVGYNFRTLAPFDKEQKSTFQDVDYYFHDTDTNNFSANCPIKSTTILIGSNPNLIPSHTKVN